jgi:uncharacterized membrane protein YoaK (UPF0700 family)
MPYHKAVPLHAAQDRKRVLAGGVALAGCAGFVNAVLLSFFQAPVSHMSGAMSHLGVAIASAPSQVAGTLSVIVAFCLGCVASGVIIGRVSGDPGRRYGAALLIEGTVLAGAASCLHTHLATGVPLAAFACGLQNATTSSYRGLGMRTTHVTGMVTDLGVVVGHWLRHGRVPKWKTTLLVTLTGGFLTGGVLGAAGIRWLDYRVLYVPAAGLLIAGAMYLRRHGRRAREYGTRPDAPAAAAA